MKDPVIGECSLRTLVQIYLVLFCLFMKNLAKLKEIREYLAPQNTYITLHCEAKNSSVFCNNFVKSFYIAVLIGTHIPY